MLDSANPKGHFTFLKIFISFEIPSHLVGLATFPSSQAVYCFICRRRRAAVISRFAIIFF